jgi:hypothetical protein
VGQDLESGSGAMSKKKMKDNGRGCVESTESLSPHLDLDPHLD